MSRTAPAAEPWHPPSPSLPSPLLMSQLTICCSESERSLPVDTACAPSTATTVAKAPGDRTGTARGEHTANRRRPRAPYATLTARAALALVLDGSDGAGGCPVDRRREAGADKGGVRLGHLCRGRLARRLAALEDSRAPLVARQVRPLVDALGPLEAEGVVRLDVLHTRWYDRATHVSIFPGSSHPTFTFAA